MSVSNEEREKRNEEIVKLYMNGNTIKDIARKYGLSYQMISKITQDCRIDQTNEEKKNKAKSNLFQVADEESRYIDTLYAYTKSFIKINECALDGMEIEKLKEKIASTKEAFCILSGLEMEKQKRGMPCCDFAIIADRKIIYSGWLRCPYCGKKLHKIYQDTRLDNFPLYCKQCHKTTIIKI